MKTTIKSMTYTMITIGLMSLVASCEENGVEQPLSEEPEFFNVSDEGYTTIQKSGIEQYFTVDSSDLSQIEIEGLMWMREEEKLARDVYAKFSEQYSIGIFSNIALSEQTHFKAVGVLFDLFGIGDTLGNAAGEFGNMQLQELYDSLVLEGSESLISALKVGAAIEEIDIIDLENFINNTDNENIILVYENLLKGSRNHLRAFTRQLEKYDIFYVPQYLDMETYSEIVNSDMERRGFGGYNYGKTKKNGEGQEGKKRGNN